VVVRDPSVQQVFKVDLIPYEQAVQRALNCAEHGEVETYLRGGRAGLKPGKTSKIIEGMFIEQRRLETVAEPTTLYATFAGIGGNQGWFYAQWLWQLRGLLDKLVGGVGMRSGQRRNDAEIQPGDVVGGYRVEIVEEGHLVRLRNEMKAPGPAWMQFEVQPHRDGGSLYIQTAFFEPHGLAGLAVGMGCAHSPAIFNGMARAIVKGETRSNSSRMVNDLYK
jgi:hypothetical protein